MESNKHDAMEQNEENILTNILVYGTPETELRWQRYGLMKRLRYFGVNLGFDPIQIWAARKPRSTGALAGVDEEDGGAIFVWPDQTCPAARGGRRLGFRPNFGGGAHIYR